MSLEIKVKDDLSGVDFVETLTSQAVRGTNTQGQALIIPGAMQDITTKYSMSNEDIALQLADFNKQRLQLLHKQAAELKYLDDNIASLNTAIANVQVAVSVKAQQTQQIT